MNATQANATVIRKFLDPLAIGPGWTAACVRHIRDATFTNVTEVAEGFVTRNSGKAVWFRENGTSNAWGIDLPTCQKFCSRAVYPMQFTFPLFSSGVTNYLLPWLGLCAQLPYETGSHFNNFMSFCVAVGSPMLITFSLTITSLNSHATEKRFADVIQDDNVDPHYAGTLRSACYFLRASQQAPLRVNEAGLTELMALPPSSQATYWRVLSSKMRKTQRPVTFSLIAQTLFAIIAWILTIAASYITSLGVPAQALLLSSGTLWTWLVPVVLGYVFVGTQATEGTVKDALQGVKPEAFKVRSGFDDPSRKVPDVLTGGVQGDESIPGPAFNYARIFTYYKLVEIVAHRFEGASGVSQAPDEVIDGVVVDTGAASPNDANAARPKRGSQELRPVSSHGSSQTRTNDSNGQANGSNIPAPQDIPSPSLSRPTTPEPEAAVSRDRAASTGGFLDVPTHPTHRRSNSSSSLLDPRGLPRLSTDLPTSRSHDHGTFSLPQPPRDALAGRSAYVKRTDLNSTWWRNFYVANLLAIFLHWGTSGAAIVISYLTETRGLGCRSGSYTLYGILGTFVHILLLSSVCFSHKAMLLYQTQPPSTPTDPSANSPHGTHALYTTLAVLTRMLGKAIAVANATWLILSSIFELIGFYDSCWCTGTVLELGTKGWVVLFISPTELRELAEASWAGGIAMSIVVAGATLVVVWRWSSGMKGA